ncbi:FKBP-type peptidyl-prolyl cis-trans isomerase [Rhizomicrobium palustre]|uniref:Peptidyl-prolyl cis-trans isomerase n=1 Tax=Rhizomicrobium palustre TaxID=189966 RepID=A0A846N0A7_9PROT|nr:FKBP-type peptidyl-prolyl cis-trans isomerase [Rhizomicrobium palustre]NIK89308.1 FKBP-type peptidyl-prolyl cis-trans isomerase [Rhizomicrobium palustre]
MRIWAPAFLSLGLLVVSACDGKTAPAPAPLSPEANAAFLANNAKKKGVVSVPGIQYEVLKKGSGAQPERSDCVSVYYKGTLIDGKVFDETKPGEPATFPAGRLIPGWTWALQMMHEGDKWRLTVPSILAYGRKGAGDGVIPPDQTLVFEIELLKVIRQGQEGC